MITALLLLMSFFTDFNQTSGAVELYSSEITDNNKITHIPYTYSDYKLLAAAGKITGTYVLHKFGSNNDVGIVEEDIWQTGGVRIYMQTPEYLNIRAGNINDTSNGSGARTIKLIFLNSDFILVSEIISLNGVNDSLPTSIKVIRLIRAWIETVGTYTGSNTGNIIIENESNEIQCTILAGLGQTQITHFTVPDNTSAYMSGLNIHIEGGNKSCTIWMYRREHADSLAPYYSKRVVLEFSSIEGGDDINMKSYEKFNEKTDIWFTGIVPTTEVNVDINYDLILVEN